MTLKQFDYLIGHYGIDNPAIKHMIDRVDKGEEVKDLHYTGISNAAALYGRKK